MHLRISAVLCYAILAGFATTSQSTSDRYNRWNDPSDNIDIDGELEGSGGGTEVSRDLEASGSGYGPDDEDSQIPIERGGKIDPVEPTHAPPVDDRDINLGKASEEDSNKHRISGSIDNTDVIMDPKPEERPTSFFAQPGILAAVIGGAVVGLLCAILVVMFIVYRMRKKDEGSYPLDEQKRPSSTNYRGNNKEFYA